MPGLLQNKTEIPSSSISLFYKKKMEYENKSFHLKKVKMNIQDDG